MKPSTKRKQPELDETLSAAVETKRPKADRCFLKHQSKRRRSEDSPTQITPTNKRIISRDGNFSLRLSEVDELASPLGSFEAPSYYSASSLTEMEFSKIEVPDVPASSQDAVTAERYILDYFNKIVAAQADKMMPDLQPAQQAYEASPAPVKRLVARKVGLTNKALREKIYGDISVYG
jgi:hypothetical protein